MTYVTPPNQWALGLAVCWPLSLGLWSLALGGLGLVVWLAVPLAVGAWGFCPRRVFGVRAGGGWASVVSPWVVGEDN